MQIPTEIIAAVLGVLLTVWIGLQFSLLKRIGQLETQHALNRQRIAATERLLDDVLQRYFHNRNKHSQTQRNIDPDNDSGNGDADNGGLDP